MGILFTKREATALLNAPVFPVDFGHELHYSEISLRSQCQLVRIPLKRIEGFED
jgi:hypothetical protein